MFSFRSILFAAAALATFTSAIPTPDSTTGSSVAGAPNALGALGGLSSGGIVPAGLPAPLKRGHASAGDILKKCHGDITVHSKKIHDACHPEGGKKYIKHDIIIEILGEIIIVLKETLRELKLCVKFEFLLEGVVCTIKEIAHLVADLLILIIELVYLVLSLIGFLDFKLCGLITLIGELLCEILVVVFALVEGLLELVIELLVPYGAHCKYVHWGGLLEILHIVL